MTLPYRAIFFDLDGTLVDANEPIAEAILALSRDAGLAVPDRAWAVGRIGFSPEETWRLLGASDPRAMTSLFRERYATHVTARTRLLPGVREALVALRGGGRRLALATTRITASARDTLEHQGLAAHFEHIGGGDLVARHKPAPDVIHLLLERLACRPDEALMVGDTTADIGAAHAAGLPCWSVLGGVHDEGTLREAGADLILSGVAELPAALARHAPRPG
jgi:HAD superfamily hydrolase (TIGR01509 family)